MLPTHLLESVDFVGRLILDERVRLNAPVKMPQPRVE